MVTDTAAKGLAIVYDGQCPFCTSYVTLVRLREAVGPVELVDARSEHPRVAEARRLGHDLDRGMVVFFRGRDYHGHEALHLIATLAGTGGGFNRLQRWLFGSRRCAALVYPLLARGRRMFLRLVGRPPLHDREKSRSAAE